MNRYARPALAVVFVAMLATPALIRRYGSRAGRAARRRHRMRADAVRLAPDRIGEGGRHRLRARRRRRSTRRLSHIMPQVASMGAAVAVADVDADGHPDLYVTNSREGSANRLYRNRGDGTFEDVAGAVRRRRRQPARDRRVDGRRVRRLRQRRLRGPVPLPLGPRRSCSTTTAASGSRGSTACALPALGQHQHRRVARLRPRRPARSLHRRLLSPKRVDLWKLADTKIMPESFEYANNGGRKYLYRNLGGGRFEEVSAQGRPRLDALGARRGRRRSARHAAIPISSSPTTTASRSSSSTKAAASAKSGARPASATRRRAA